MVFRSLGDGQALALGGIGDAQGQGLVLELPPGVVVGKAAGNLAGVPLVLDGVIAQDVIEGIALGVAGNQIVSRTKPSAQARIPGARGGVELAQVIGEARHREDDPLGKGQVGESQAVAKEVAPGNSGHDPAGEVDRCKVDVALEGTGKGLCSRDIEATTVKGKEARVVLEPRFQAGGGDVSQLILVISGPNRHGGDGGLVHGGQPRKLVGGIRDGLGARGIQYIY